MSYRLVLRRKEAQRLQEHGAHYGIVEEVLNWLWDLAGEAAQEPSGWRSLDDILDTLESEETLAPRGSLRLKLRDLLYSVTHLRPPRILRCATEPFPLLDGTAGVWMIVAVLEVDHANRQLIVRNLLDLPGPPEEPS